MQLFDVDLLGRAQAPEPPQGTFNEFNLYQVAVYSRADLMYGMLRDMSATARSRRFSTTTTRAGSSGMSTSSRCERARSGFGRDLGWFFAQWVHHTGLIDYALEDVDTKRDGDGWLTRARILRRAEYRHAMPVGARTRGRMDHRARRSNARRTVGRDSNGRQADGCATRSAQLHRGLGSAEQRARVAPMDGRATVYVRLDWPFLAQSDRDRHRGAMGPKAWYTGPGGATGAVRFRSNYASAGDEAWDTREFGIAVSSRVPVDRTARST